MQAVKAEFGEFSAPEPHSPSADSSPAQPQPASRMQSMQSHWPANSRASKLPQRLHAASSAELADFVAMISNREIHKIRENNFCFSVRVVRG